MFRPYLAVIQDSYRAALSSRVLYIVLSLIALILLVLAPFHSRETLDWKIANSETAIPKPQRLIERLVDEGQSGSRAAVAHIWNQFSPEFQSELNEAASKKTDSGPDRNPRRGMRRRLAQELNSLLEGESLYNEAAFAGKRLNKETQELIGRGDRRTRIENRRLNRLLVSSALRRDIAMPGATQIDFYYFRWPLSALSVNMSQSELAEMLTSELPGYFDKFIMSIGIFIAILITASIIPEMLESGSLNLFLSKPVSRWLILLAKYLGGCVFISLCAAFLFVGLWLWAGVQLRIWEPAILISIPVYVFVFAMYYSVSVLAGLWFRSPILSITCALLFWAVCWSVGSVYTWLDNSYYNSSARQLLVHEEQVAMVDLLVRNYVWDSTEEAWRDPSPPTRSQEGNPLIFGSYFGKFDELPEAPGPAFDNDSGQFFFANESAIGIIRGGPVSLASTFLADLSKTVDHGKLPSDTLQFFCMTDLGLIAIDSSGRTSQLINPTSPESNGEIATNQGTGQSESSDKNNLTDRLLNWVGQKPEAQTFKEILPRGEFDIPNTQAAAQGVNEDSLLIFSNGSLHQMNLNEDRSASQPNLPLCDLENENMTAFVRAANSRGVVMLGNGQLYLIDLIEFTLLDSIDVTSRPPIRTMAISPKGDSLAVTYRNGELIIYDISGTHIKSVAKVPGNDFMACAYNSDGQLWTSDRFNAVFNYQPETDELVVRYQPKSDWTGFVFRGLIRPLYRNFPKPGEFYKLISYLAEANPDDRDLNIDRTKQVPIDNPWDPLKSGIIFTICVLVVACTLFQRLDF